MCSRRDADRYIELGNVFINGKRAQIGDKVKVGDLVKVNGQPIEPREAEDFIVIALNKPVGIVSTTERSERDNMVDFVNHSKRIFPIGRLDKDSQGLILLTNNGDLVNKILRAGNKHEKEYLVTVNKPITDEFIAGMADGVPILGRKTKKCRVIKESATTFRMTLVQGLNRQIRRMCEYFNYEVTALNRTRIMHISLKGLPVGDWRDLTTDELAVLSEAIQYSSSEDGHKQRPKKKTNHKTNHKNKQHAQKKQHANKKQQGHQTSSGNAKRKNNAQGERAGRHKKPSSQRRNPKSPHTTGRPKRRR